MKVLAHAIAALLLVFAASCATAPPTSAGQSPIASSVSTADPVPVPPIFVEHDASPISAAPSFLKFPGYLQELVQKVQAEWDRTIALSSVRPLPRSKASIRFVLNSDGVVTRIVEVEETAGKQGTFACLQAIRNPQPYRSWTPEMIEILGREQTLTFTFVYD